MKAIIPTGGRGTRMQPVTYSENKHFIPVANKPLVFYPIETIAATGIKDVGITYNANGLEKAKAILGSGSKWGLHLTYILQEKPLGLANIIESCEQYIDGDSFVLHLGDNIFVDGINEFVDYFIRKQPCGLLAMVHHKDNTRLGVPYFDDNGSLVRYVEKPKNPPHDFAIPGLYFFSSVVFECFKGKNAIKPSERGEYEISALYQWLIDRGFRVDVLEYKGKWLDPGKIDDWIEANQYLVGRISDSEIESKVGKSVKIENIVKIGKRCKITDSHIRGPVVIGDDVTISSALIGPYTSVNNCCLIENSRIENSVLMPSVKICNIKKTIDSSLIGTNSELIENNSPDNCISLFVGEKSSIKM